MKLQHVLIILLLAAFIVTATTPTCSAASLSKPNITLLSGWELSGETPYPNEVGEHDQGAGLVEYENSETFDFIMIYYENAPSNSYTSAQLKSEAEDIFYRDLDVAFSESGTTIYAGVQAGFAKAYNSDYDVYQLEIVLIKGGYYLDIYAVYDATDEAQDAVESIINSISVDAGLGSMLYIIVGTVVVIIVIVVVVFIIKRKKKVASLPMSAYQGNMPIPPPPPT